MTQSDSQDFFLARQPILDRNETIVAYELLFRSGTVNRADVSDDFQATSNVIVHAFSDLGLGTILGSNKGFLNFNAQLLMSDVVELLPKDQVVIELLETIKITDEVIARCQELKDMGFTLALDDFVSLQPEHEPLMPLLSIVKMEVPALSQNELFKTVIQLKRWPVQLLAEKIDSLEQAQHCKKLGFDLFQGYYFSRPAIMSGKRADASKYTLLQLLSAVLSEAETVELEQTLKHDPGLTHSLLRLVNSVAMGLRYKISSLKQAIVVLGRRQLQRWLELLLFVHQSSAAFPSPLLILAATRGRLLEILAGIMARHGLRSAKDFEERAFLVGVMSLLDALLSMPMEEIIPQLNFDEDIKMALIKREGLLGDMLRLAELLEQNDYLGVHDLLPHLSGVQIGDLAKAQIDAMGWATSIGKGVVEQEGGIPA